MKLSHVFRFESKHLGRNKFKVAAITVFILGGIYVLILGSQVRESYLTEIQKLKDKSTESKNQVLTWFDEGKSGPEDRAWVDITNPFWAIWYTPSNVYKNPSPLMVFSTGQAETFGYQKSVTNWSTVYDNDLIGEISNPERLSVGSVDFSFMVLYIAPLLLVILLFNINGMEHDLGINTIIKTQSANQNRLLFARSSYYTSVVIFLTMMMVLGAGILGGAFISQFQGLLTLCLLIIGYLLVWHFLFFWLIKTSKGSNGQAIKMVSVWILLCVLIPGFVHQNTDARFPENFKTDYLDAGRVQVNEIFELSAETRAENLKSLFPSLIQSASARDSVANIDAINDSSSALVNDLMKKAAKELEDKNELKNRFIVSTYWYNPVSFFQNKFNAIAETDYYAYADFRKKIQETIDQKTELIVLDSWDKTTVTKEKYLEYYDKCNQSSQ